MAVNQSGCFQRFLINGSPLPSSYNILRKVVIQCGYGLPLPVAHLLVSDTHNILTGELAIIDGTIFTIILGPNEEETSEYEFVYVSSNEVAGADDNQVEVFCVINNPKLSTESAMDLFESMPSTDAMQALAGKVGLEYDGPKTTPSDSMTWINSGKTRAQYLKMLNDHSYIGESDCLTTLVDFDKIITREAIANQEEEAAHVFYHQLYGDDPKAVAIEEVTPENRSGILNHHNSYGYKHIQHSLTGEDLEFDQIKPKAIGKGLNINADVKGEIERSKLSFGKGFDAGGAGLGASNVHDNYYKATYVNMRIMSLFSNYVRIANRSGYLNPDLLSVGDLRLSANKSAGPSESERYAGKYNIGGKTLVMQPPYYMEVYDLYRSYITLSGNTEPVSGSADTGEGFDPESDPDAITQDTDLNTNANKNVQGNTASTKVPSVTDDANQLAQQTQAKYSDTTANPINKLVDSMNAVSDNLDKTFKEASEKYGFKELKDKWGAASDKLLALGAEFRAAKAKLDLCKQLNGLQKLTVETAVLRAPELLSDISKRMNDINGAIALMDKMLEDAGVLDLTNPNDPGVNIECGAEMTNALNNSAKGTFSDACLDDKAFRTAQLPKLKAMRKVRELERLYEDLACSTTKKLTS